LKGEQTTVVQQVMLAPELVIRESSLGYIPSGLG